MNFAPPRARFLTAVAITFALAGVFAFFAAANPALAQTDQLASVGTGAGFNTETDFLTTVGQIISIVLGLLGVGFLLLLIYSGFVWMTAGGDDEKVKKAKKILINATIGIIIVLMSYAIATFVINALGDATGNGNGSGNNGNVSIETLSGSLGAGPIRDHYPERSASGVARNTRIIVTFKEEMSTDSFIAASTTNSLNTDNVHIFANEEGEAAFLTDVTVAYTEDMKTFVFDPVTYLGSATEDMSYTVSLGSNIQNVDGEEVFTGSYSGGYEWSFEVSTEIDLDPPAVVSVIPASGGTFDRNIAIEITFDEAIDPTSATGTREASSGFQNIQTLGSASSSPLAGTYEISNRYRTITFTSDNACGTNSCGETIYCLPGNDAITVTAYAATTEIDPPQADAFPYDGVADTSANSLDANNDGVAGDDYAWSFSTTDEINLEGAAVQEIAPNILEEGVALDQDITVLFDDIMMSSTISSETISMENSEETSGSSHEMWYAFAADSLDADGAVVVATEQAPTQTRATINHGVFLESTGGLTYYYGVVVGQGVKNQYQNCYSPAEGTTQDGGACAVDSNSPSCCNGTAQSASCDLFAE